MEEVIRKVMKRGQIPGLCIVIVKEDEEDQVYGFGFSDLSQKVSVTQSTLFELASCSKAFTALAALKLEEQGKLELDGAISDYLPWFYVSYFGQKKKITINQLLHHTSGIPWSTILMIPCGNQRDSLEKTVKGITGIQLNHSPGDRYQYTSLNYDIVGLIIEKLSGLTFEEYMQEHILKPLEMNHTFVGVKKRGHPSMAMGYKTGLFRAGKYLPPVFRGNNPAAYIISSGHDMARWLKYQLGLLETDLEPLIKRSHKLECRPDYSRRSEVLFTKGWELQRRVKGEIFHTGLNPTFTSYIILRPADRIGVAVLANSNSKDTFNLTNYIMGQLTGRKGRGIYIQDYSLSKLGITASLYLGGYLLLALNILGVQIIKILSGEKVLKPFTQEKIFLFVLPLLVISIFITSIHFGRFKSLKNVWKSVMVWASKTITLSVVLFILSTIVSIFILYTFIF